MREHAAAITAYLGGDAETAEAEDVGPKPLPLADRQRSLRQ
jgi:hypothetical protein